MDSREQSEENNSHKYSERYRTKSEISRTFLRDRAGTAGGEEHRAVEEFETWAMDKKGFRSLW
jgi:hypothetical protein